MSHSQIYYKRLHIASWLMMIIFGAPFYILPLFLLGLVNKQFIYAGLIIKQFTMDPIDSFVSALPLCGGIDDSFCAFGFLASILAPPLYALLYLIFSWAVARHVFQKTQKFDYRFIIFAAVLVAISALIIFSNIQLTA